MKNRGPDMLTGYRGKTRLAKWYAPYSVSETVEHSEDASILQSDRMRKK